MFFYPFLWPVVGLYLRCYVQMFKSEHFFLDVENYLCMLVVGLAGVVCVK